MSTDQTFNAVLKRYTPLKLHREEMKRHNWFFEKIDKKTDWVGGTMEIPFEGAAASTVQWNSLAATDDVSEAQEIMGELTKSDLKELWGTMKFHNSDLRRHGDMKKSYLQLLPGRIEQFTRKMSDMVSVAYLGDGSLAKLTADGANGSIVVDFPQRFELGQKVELIDSDSAVATAYITGIDINTKTLLIKDARTGGANVDASAFTVASGASVSAPNNSTGGPQGLKSILLSATNGGSADYFGHTKTDFTALQALNIDGSGFDKDNLLDDLYSAFYQVLELGKGSLDKTLVMPLSFMQYLGTQLEASKRYDMKMNKVTYGMKNLDIIGPDGHINIIAIRDMPKDICYVLDWKGVCLAGNSFFKRDADANGNEFYVERNTTGKVNYVDTCFEAALVVQACSHQGIIYGIPDLATT